MVGFKVQKWFFWIEGKRTHESLELRGVNAFPFKTGLDCKKQLK